MTYDPSEGVYQYIDEQIGFPHQTAGHRPKQVLPRKDSVAEAKRQAGREARVLNLRGNTHLPPDAYPNVRQRTAREEDELYRDAELYIQRPPRSAVRYQREETYLSGNKRVHVQYADMPPRRSALSQQPPAHQYQQERDREDIDEQEIERAKPKRGRSGRVHFHPLLWLGLGMIVMVFLWVAYSNALNWWQIHQNDSTYGRPRTFQIDAVVGHGDSTSNPSHFIALNLNRHVLVIEIPGGDPIKARIYPVTTLFGDGQELTPITISFKDVDGDGLVDMEIHIEDQTLVMINDNGTFRPLKAGERVHL